MKKINIKKLTYSELKKILREFGLEPYRASQLYLWLYKKGIHDFSSINNMPAALLTELDKKFYIGSLALAEHFESTDGTEKFLFKLSDGNFIETVLIPSGRRNTTCMSTQVGCKFRCSFCASGKRGFIRDLKTSEITEQILYIRHQLKCDITNYVFMGMGEPLDNFENLSKAIIIMNDPKGLGIGARRITVSTCGIIPGINKLAELGIQVNLSISLHAANNILRNKLVPVNKRYPLEKIICACENYINKVGRMITIEYVLIKDMNDSLNKADELKKIAKRLGAKVNLIPYSEVQGFNYRRPSGEGIDKFLNKLIKSGVNVTLRESKGADINAACGQLVGRRMK